MICTEIDAVEGCGQLIQAVGPLYLTFDAIESWLNKKIFWGEKYKTFYSLSKVQCSGAGNLAFSFRDEPLLDMSET